jgi:Fe-S-cluster containining protein
MKCLRCGHCCINYAVIILDNPDLPLTETNVRFKPDGERCPHLRGDAPGKYSCAVHDHPQYQETPCFDFGQIEESPEDPCRIGMYILQTKGV